MGAGRLLTSSELACALAPAVLALKKRWGNRRSRLVFRGRAATRAVWRRARRLFKRRPRCRGVDWSRKRRLARNLVLVRRLDMNRKTPVAATTSRAQSNSPNRSMTRCLRTTVSRGPHRPIGAPGWKPATKPHADDTTMRGDCPFSLQHRWRHGRASGNHNATW